MVQPHTPRSGPSVNGVYSPRDQEKDSGMIEHLQNAFRARLRPRVVKRGPEIQPQHCQSENDCADKKTVAAGIACREEQHWSGD